MKKVLALALVALAASAVQAQTWSFDRSHSSVAFAVKHLLVSTTRGEFDSFTVELAGDAAKPTSLSAKVSIPVASIDTRTDKRDEHLRSPDFFDAAKFPTIEFVSTKVVKKGKQWAMLGNLTMHGVTKAIEIPFTITGPVLDPWKNTRVGLEGSLTLNRMDYGVGTGTPDAVASEQVVINISYEGILQK
jgi:polyisoprenoid-binding protein YceI